MSAIKNTTIVFDFVERKLFCNGRVVVLNGKRTAIYIHCLISCFLHSRPFTKQALGLALAADEPGIGLDRTTLKRLVETADEALRQVTAGEQQRITYRPRTFTTGPWSLMRLPDEQWVIAGQNFETAPTDADPALTHCGDAALGCDLAHSLLVIDAQIDSGQHKDAAQLITALTQSAALSVEMKCLLNLRLVRLLRSSAGLASIPAVLTDIELAAAKLPVRLQQYFGGQVAMFEARQVFDQSPVKGAFEIDFLQLRQHLDASPSTSLQWEWYNLKALTLRRRIVTLLQANSPRALVEDMAGEIPKLFSAAYFWTLVSKRPYNSQAVACNYAYNLYWLYSKQLYPNLDACVAWFKLAHTIVDKFDLPQDSAWDFLMLGDIYLKSPEAKKLIAQDALAWPEQANPANEAFYLRALDLAQTFGGARQHITALNQIVDFLQQSGAGSRKSGFIETRDLLLRQHPQVFAEMLKDGFVIA